eukprot:jgi/Ulvmu1/12292/UM088_0008.1
MCRRNLSLCLTARMPDLAGRSSCTVHSVRMQAIADGNRTEYADVEFEVDDLCDLLAATAEQALTEEAVHELVEAAFATVIAAWDSGKTGEQAEAETVPVATVPQELDVAPVALAPVACAPDMPAVAAATAVAAVAAEPALSAGSINCNGKEVVKSARPVRATYASVLRAPPLAEATTADHQHDLQPAPDVHVLLSDIAAAQSQALGQGKQAPRIQAAAPLPVAAEAPAGGCVHDAVEAGGRWTLVRCRRGRKPAAVAQAATTEAAADTARHSTWKQGAAIRGNRFELLQDMPQEHDTYTAMQEVESTVGDSAGFFPAAPRESQCTMPEAVPTVALDDTDAARAQVSDCARPEASTQPEARRITSPLVADAVAAAQSAGSGCARPEVSGVQKVAAVVADAGALTRVTAEPAAPAFETSADHACATDVGAALAARIEWALPGAVVRHNRFTALVALGDE